MSDLKIEITFTNVPESVFNAIQKLKLVIEPMTANCREDSESGVQNQKWLADVMSGVTCLQYLEKVQHTDDPVSVVLDLISARNQIIVDMKKSMEAERNKAKYN